MQLLSTATIRYNRARLYEFIVLNETQDTVRFLRTEDQGRPPISDPSSGALLAVDVPASGWICSNI